MKMLSEQIYFSYRHKKKKKFDSFFVTNAAKKSQNFRISLIEFNHSSQIGVERLKHEKYRMKMYA